MLHSEKKTVRDGASKHPSFPQRGAHGRQRHGAGAVPVAHRISRDSSRALPGLPQNARAPSRESCDKACCRSASGAPSRRAEMGTGASGTHPTQGGESHRTQACPTTHLPLVEAATPPPSGRAQPPPASPLRVHVPPVVRAHPRSVTAAPEAGGGASHRTATPLPTWRRESGHPTGQCAGTRPHFRRTPNMAARWRFAHASTVSRVAQLSAL